MTKKLSIAGLVVAAAASSAFAFGAAPANAACTTVGPGTGQNCTVFDPTSSTNLEGFGYTDQNFILNDILTSIRFGTQDGASDLNFTPTPITITGIAYSVDNGANWSTTGIDTSISLSSGGLSSNILTGGNVDTGVAWGSNFRVRFTVPSLTTSNAGQLSVRVSSDGAAGAQSQTRLFTSTVTPGTPSSGVPGPLPLLGAGAAFGFSRSMRRRIAQSV